MGSQKGPRKPLTGRCSLCSVPVTADSPTGLCGPRYRSHAGRWYLKVNGRPEGRRPPRVRTPSAKKPQT